MKRLVLMLVFIAAPLWALDPSEMLSDPAQEARARALDHALRCVVCQSEAVASSNSNWAVDARRTIRELVSEGKTDAEVTAFFVERYGEFVLMNPPARGSTWALWLAGPAMLLLAGMASFAYLRGRSRAGLPKDDALSPEEEARLKAILKD